MFVKKLHFAVTETDVFDIIYRLSFKAYTKTKQALE